MHVSVAGLLGQTSKTHRDGGLFLGPSSCKFIAQLLRLLLQYKQPVSCLCMSISDCVTAASCSFAVLQHAAAHKLMRTSLPCSGALTGALTVCLRGLCCLRLWRLGSPTTLLACKHAAV